MKEGELYKVKTDADSGYDLDSIELRVTAYTVSGVVPGGHREQLLFLMSIYFLIELEFHRYYLKFRGIRSIFHSNMHIFMNVCIGTLIA